MKEVLKNYSGIIFLLLGITIGSIIGIVAPGFVEYIKPLGDIFLNLLFVSVVPLVFLRCPILLHHWNSSLNSEGLFL